jgi:hypothetical protein
MAYDKQSYAEHVAIRVKDIHWVISVLGSEVLDTTQPAQQARAAIACGPPTYKVRSFLYYCAG